MVCLLVSETVDDFRRLSYGGIQITEALFNVPK